MSGELWGTRRLFFCLIATKGYELYRGCGCTCCICALNGDVHVWRPEATAHGRGKSYGSGDFGWIFSA